MSDDYVRQRLWQAMEALAVSAQSLQRRLADAGSSLVHLPDDAFTIEEDRADFREIMDALTRYGAGGEMGKIEASSIELDNDGALLVAQQIADLHAKYFPLIRDCSNERLL